MFPCVPELLKLRERMKKQRVNKRMLEMKIITGIRMVSPRKYRGLNGDRSQLSRDGVWLAECASFPKIADSSKHWPRPESRVSLQMLSKDDGRDVKREAGIRILLKVGLLSSFSTYYNVFVRGTCPSSLSAVVLVRDVKPNLKDGEDN